MMYQAGIDRRKRPAGGNKPGLVVKVKAHGPAAHRLMEKLGNAEPERLGKGRMMSKATRQI